MLFDKRYIQKQPWIGTPVVDSTFILLPPFLSVLIVFMLPSVFQNKKSFTDAGWVVLILLIDVAHVYSTLYRTYFDPSAFNKQKTTLLAVPFVGFVIAVLAYSISSEWFWRLLAYTAVFHFVRQQYGFMRLYGRREKSNKLSVWIDKIVIYYATIYPILYWHLNGPRNFNWFVERDFLYFKSDFLLYFFTILYITVLAAYFILEFRKWVSTRSLNLPKFAVVTGTIISWYFGIIYFNGDMAFTVLNVVSHGIPYMALIWLYGQKNYMLQGKGTKFLQMLFSKKGVIVFLGLLFLFAYLEEWLWDLFVWKEHENIFSNLNKTIPTLDDTLLSFIVPLLALPQITHYILDGFIWKIKKEEFRWNNE